MNKLLIFSNICCFFTNASKIAYSLLCKVMEIFPDFVTDERFTGQTNNSLVPDSVWVGVCSGFLIVSKPLAVTSF